MIQPGVFLHVIPSKKFKTIDCSIHFVGHLDSKTLSARSLLANILTETSIDYPTRKQLKRRLSDLYGTELHANVSRFGKRHLMNVHLSLVDEKYIEEEYIPDALKILHTVLFDPHFLTDSFDRQLFETERQQLIDELSDIYNDKQAYAIQQAQKIYFEDDAQKLPAIGQVSDLEEMTITDVQKAYEKMMAEDEVHIYVLGDVCAEKWANYFEKWEFSGRSTIAEPVIYRQDSPTEVQHKTLNQNVQQAELILAFNYQGPSDQNESAMVFNSVFGGGSHSKLFKEIREKENLAYYAYSSFNLSRSQMLVDMGIDAVHQDRAVELVKRELEKLIHEEVSGEELQKSKRSLINGLYQSEDSPYRIINRHLFSTLMRRDIPLSDQIELIHQVSTADIAGIAKQMELSVVLVLKGEEDEKN